MGIISNQTTLTVGDAVELLRKFDSVLPHGRPFLRPDEVAAILSCSEKHVYNLVQDGSLDLAVDVRRRGKDDLPKSQYACARVCRYSLLNFMVDGRML